MKQLSLANGYTVKQVFRYLVGNKSRFLVDIICTGRIKRVKPSQCKKDPQKLHPTASPTLSEMFCKMHPWVMSLFGQALSLLEPWRNCWIQHSRGVWICLLENSKSLYKPNINKLECKGKKTMFDAPAAILWILLVSQTPRHLTLCYPRDEKIKLSQVETCLGMERKIRLGEISNTFLEARGAERPSWNMLELKLPQSNDGLFKNIIFGVLMSCH